MKKIIFLCSLFCLSLHYTLLAQCPNAVNSIDISTGRNTNGLAIGPWQMDANWKIAHSHTGNAPNYDGGPAFEYSVPTWLPAAPTTAWISWYPQNYGGGNIRANWVSQIPPNPIPLLGDTSAYVMEFPFCVCDPDPNSIHPIQLNIDANFLADNVARVEIWEVGGSFPITTPPIELDLTTSNNFSNYFFWNNPQTAFGNVNPGNYVVRVTLGNDGYHVGFNFTGTVTSTSNVLLDNRNSACSAGASISGFKHGDVNQNGTVDQGEIQLPGWIIELCDVNNPGVVIDTDTTDINGYYSFPNLLTSLPPGTYIVKENINSQSGNWFSTNPTSGQYTVLVQDGDVLSLDFLNSLCLINNVNFTDGPTTFCENDLTHQYCAQAQPSGFYNYQWILNGQLLGSGQGRTVTWPSTGGTLQVVASQTFQPACTDTAQIIANIVPAPSAIISPAGLTDLCNGDTDTYYPLVGSFITDYLWTVTPDPCSGQLPYQNMGGSIMVTWPPSGGTLCLEASDTINGVTCTETECITISPCCNMQLSITTEDVCFTACDGEAMLNITGGTPPYTINWSSSANTGLTETGLCTGNYLVTVTDAGCCSLVQGFIINNQGFTLGGVSHDFDAHYTMATGRRIYLFDVDADGILDLIMPGNGIEIRPGLGNGQFGASTNPLLGNNIESVAFGNVINGGLPDIVALEKLEIHVLENVSSNGNLVLNGPTTSPIIPAGNLGGIVLEDFDGNGFDDVVIPNGGPDRVYIYSNTNGVFTLANTLTAPSAISYWEPQVFDIDGINGPDIVIGVGGGSNTIHAYLNQGGGSFTNSTTAELDYNTPGGAWPRGLHFADIDGVGNEDMIVAMQQSSELIVNTDLTNLNPVWQRYPTGGQPVGIDVADLDNDGDNDVLVAVHFPTTFIRVFINDGTGLLSSFVDHTTPIRSLEVMSGDLEGDCCIDFVTVNQGSNANDCSVFLNECHDQVFVVQGFVFCEDNCTAGAPLVGASVQILDQSNGSTYTVVTDANGMYSLSLPGNPNNFNISLPANNYATACGAGPITNFNPGPNQNPAPNILVENECGITVNLTSSFAGNTVGNNCPYTNLPCEDLLWNYCVEFRNDGCGDVLVDSFALTLPANITFTQPIPDLVECNTNNPVGSNVLNVPTNIVTWDMSNNFIMPAGACYTACVQVEFTSGFTLPVTAIAESSFSCGNSDGLSEDDGVIYNDTCSCDPNYKLVYPNGCGDFGIVGNEELTYTVNFANIGAGPAFDIVVKDQLAINLDWSTFQWVGSSHTITANNIDANGLLTVEYTGIILPPNNGGWFKYKIKPLTNVANMTTITNSAKIYFDSNPAVVTNTVSNLIIIDPLEVDILPTCPVVYLGYEPLECVKLEAIAAGGYPGYSYQWSTGESTDVIQVCPTTNTTYSVTITDKAGCTVEEEIRVIVVDVRCGKKNKKVKVCHTDKRTGQQMQLCIDPSLVAGHLAHGDFLGDCDAGDPCGGSGRNAVVEEAAPTGFRWSVYPNPNNGTFQVRLQLTSEVEAPIGLTIYNNLGQLIDQREIEVSGSAVVIPISLQDRAAGVYILRLQTPEGEVVERVIIN